MKKSDLKTGMLVEYRNGMVYMVINDALIGFSEHNSIGFHREDLSSKTTIEHDIIAVSHVLSDWRARAENWNSKTINANLLWQHVEETPICTIDGVEYSESTLRSIIKKAHGSD